MSTAQELIEQGLKQGLEQGRKQGLEKGRKQGLERVLRSLLSARFGRLAPEVERKLESATPADVERWAVRVLSAKEIDDVFEKARPPRRSRKGPRRKT